MRSLSPEDLEATKTFLSRLAVKDGTVVTEPSLIFALDGSGTIETPLDRNDPSSAEVLVKTVKALRNAFCFLENVALEGLVHVRTEVSAFGKDYASIDDLLDELLVDILHRVRVRGSIEPLLGTSRSIRKRITNLPEFWTNISTKTNPTNYLEWSKPRKLAVTVCESRHTSLSLPRAFERQWGSEIRQDMSRTKTFLSLVGLHSSRWKSFDFCKRADEVSLMQILAAESYPKVFPNLEYLALAYNDQESREITQLQNTDDAVKDFVSLWEMPALDHLRLKNFIPSKIRGSPISFELELHIDETEEEWNLTRLTVLLDPFKRLTQLSISLHYMYEGRHEGSPAVLENLKTLYLRVEGGTADFLVAALASFEAPNVQDLSLDLMCDDPDEDEFPKIHALFPNDIMRWPKATSLSIQSYFSVRDDLGQPTCLHIALARLPRLNHLIVRSTYHHGLREDEEFLSQGYQNPRLAVHPSLRENQSSFPPLHSLTLDRCPFDAAFFMNHAHIFTSPNFRRMEIRKCGNIDAIVLRSLLPSDKVLSYDGKRILPLMA